ncbi:MAG TPA: DUF6514 family protein [Clostridiales bacterium]|nr:DUF6514 family protein [Clostridiales bacterium]
MYTKTLERKLSIKNSTGDSQYEIPIELEYYLLESHSDYYNGLEGEKVYGIGILKKLDEACCEESAVKNFFCSSNEAKEIVEKLADNEVTPMSLTYILDDLLETDT